MAAAPMETNPTAPVRRSPKEEHPGLTCKQYQALVKHFEVDRNPSERTMKELADRLKLTKKKVKVWFHYRRGMMKFSQFCKDNEPKMMRDFPEANRHTRLTLLFYQFRKMELAQQPSQKEEPGLPEALDALEKLKLSSGYQSRDGESQNS